MRRREGSARRRDERTLLLLPFISLPSRGWPSIQMPVRPISSSSCGSCRQALVQVGFETRSFRSFDLRQAHRCDRSTSDSRSEEYQSYFKWLSKFCQSWVAIWVAANAPVLDHPGRSRYSARACPLTMTVTSGGHAGPGPPRCVSPIPSPSALSSGTCRLARTPSTDLRWGAQPASAWPRGLLKKTNPA
jgi:hypothetical protein